MNSNYLFGIFGAIIIVALGVFLIGRDGTEEPRNTLTTPQENVAEESLPIDNDATNDTVTEDSTLPELESETDSDDANAEVKDIEDSGSDNEELSEEESIETTTVTYTNQGFSPKTITVNKGDEVTWVNNSSRNMWIASAIHPTHNEYPEESDEDCGGSTFDACIGIAVGQSWSFIFNEVGSWDYHDHLNSSRTGTIEVE